ncbi:hypothetical protein HD806DRAFT_552284 [Xylariaceae sp. AK1471]|nr:hypothetical protein HD806DRAFT_552284 [Xylariaceae sp. AK1471]
MPEQSPTQRLLINKLRETLPNGWQVFETLEHNYLFRNNSTEDTTWDRLDAEINCALYTSLLDYPNAEFEPKYKVISYTWRNEMPREAIRVMTSPPPQVTITVVNTEETEDHAGLKVYGVLSLLGPTTTKFITPDYHAPAAKASLDLVLAIAQVSGTLNLVGTGGLDLPQDVTPSCVPNLASLETVWTGQWQLNTDFQGRDAGLARQYARNTLRTFESLLIPGFVYILP